METITKTLRNLHEKWDVTQDELGAFFGLKRGQMANILQLKAKPPLKVLVSLSELVGVSQKELFDRTLSGAELPDRTEYVVQERTTHYESNGGSGSNCEKLLEAKETIIQELRQRIKDKEEIIELLKQKL